MSELSRRTQEKQEGSAVGQKEFEFVGWLTRTP